MMQHQEIASTNQSKIGTENATRKTTGADLNIDFDNVEDILDFNMHPSPETDYNTSPKQRPPQRHKRIAEKPVQLFEIIPLIDDFVNNEEEYCEDIEDHETEVKSKRRFRCVYCGSKFIRSSHLRRHLYSHTGAKPYFCPICRIRFSRSDYVLIHTQIHHKNKIHSCCICGKLYFDLTLFADHCHLHADSEYIRIAMDNTTKARMEENQLQIAQDSIPAATCAKEIELLSCVKIETVDNSFSEEDIVLMENPIYSSHMHHNDQTIFVYNDQYALLSSGISSNSICPCSIPNTVQFVPQLNFTLQTERDQNFDSTVL